MQQHASLMGLGGFDPIGLATEIRSQLGAELDLPSSTPNAESEPFSRCALNEINNLVMRGEVSVVARCGVRSAGNIRR